MKKTYRILIGILAAAAVVALIVVLGGGTQNFSAKYAGICRKALIFILVGVGHILDTYVAGSGAAIRTAVICFYLSNEGLSLLENAARLGLPVPERLKEALRQLHGTEQE